MRYLRALLVLVVMRGGTILAQGQPPEPERGLGCNSNRVTVRLFQLDFISNADAAKLLAPFVPASPYCGVFDAGGAVHGVTVKAHPDVLARVDSLLRIHDRASPPTVLRFQLIAALDSAVRDAAIPPNVDATLRDLFRFGGYRLLAQGTATTGTSSFEITMSAGYDIYMVAGVLGSSVSGRGGRGTTSQAPYASPVTTAIEMNVRLTGPGANRQLQTLLSTGLSIPIGETVVLGSAATTSGGRQALILTVRPEMLGPAKR